MKPVNILDALHVGVAEHNKDNEYSTHNVDEGDPRIARCYSFGHMERIVSQTVEIWTGVMASPDGK